MTLTSSSVVQTTAAWSRCRRQRLVARSCTSLQPLQTHQSTQWLTWVCVYGLTSHSTLNRSFQRRVLKGNRLHWYWPQIYIFYSWMCHWPIMQQQTMSQSQGDNRSKSHLHFCIGIQQFTIFNTYYHISSNKTPACIRYAACIWDLASIRGNTIYICRQIYNVKYSKVGHVM